MEDIIRKFKDEFSMIETKFIIIEEKIVDLVSSVRKFIYHPGVYIYHLNGEIIKVGRHLTNSRKRALEHIVSNTKNEKLEMKDLIDNPNCKVTLLNVKDPQDYHWVAAVEIYMEKVLNPIIKSKRH